MDFLFNHRTGVKTSISYFFCDFSDPRSLKPETLLAALIKQILSLAEQTPCSLENELESLFAKNYRKPDIKELFGILRKVIQLNEDAYLVVDGLD